MLNQKFLNFFILCVACLFNFYCYATPHADFHEENLEQSEREALESSSAEIQELSLTDIATPEHINLWQHYNSNIKPGIESHARNDLKGEVKESHIRAFKKGNEYIFHTQSLVEHSDGNKTVANHRHVVNAQGNTTKQSNLIVGSGDKLNARTFKRDHHHWRDHTEIDHNLNPGYFGGVFTHFKAKAAKDARLTKPQDVTSTSAKLSSDLAHGDHYASRKFLKTHSKLPPKAQDKAQDKTSAQC